MEEIERYDFSEDVKRGCDTVVQVCADLKPDEKILIVSEEHTRKIAEAIENTARKISNKVTHKIISPFTMHGQEPPGDVAVEMGVSQVIIGLTRMSMAHSQSRFIASNNGARYLSLPDYSMEVLASPAMHADFRALTDLSMRLAEFFSNGKEVFLRTRIGTNLRCDIEGRSANAAPGWCWKPGTLASPPDAETNIAIVENGSNGIIMVDGSIPCPELGLIKEPIKVTIKEGQIEKVEGGKADVLNRLLDRIEYRAARILGELGVGLNPLAKLRGYMLEDEGCLGTAHVGIGSNATIGGKNSLPFHLDLIVKDASIEMDGKLLVENGRILI